MAKGIHARGFENDELPSQLTQREETVRSGAVINLAPAFTLETKALSLQPGFEWFNPERDHSWILWGHTHRSTFPQFPHGMFTLRCEIDPGSRSKTLADDMKAGKRRGAFMFSDYKLPNEDKERPLFLFWVDLLIASRLAEGMKPRQNSRGGRFWLFDWTDPATRACATRYEL